MPALEAGFWEFDSPLGHQSFSLSCWSSWFRTPGFQSGDRGFESRTRRQTKSARGRQAASVETDHKDWVVPELVTGIFSAPLTQRPECLPVQEEAEGSIPSRGANDIWVASSIGDCDGL